VPFYGATALRLSSKSISFSMHKALRITPAMAAGTADHVSGLEEIVGLLDNQQARQAAA
jgi:hypothetical protein